MEDRISRLETEHAFLERTVEQLNEALCRQQDELDFLKRRLEQLEAQRATGTEAIVDKRPPHY